MTLREAELLAENEALREELRCLRESITPTGHRWYRLNLTKTDELVLDLLWESTRVVSADQILLRMNFARAKQNKKPISTRNAISVLMHRLRHRLEDKVHVSPIAIIPARGYYLLPEHRPALEKWMS